MTASAKQNVARTAELSALVAGNPVAAQLAIEQHHAARVAVARVDPDEFIELVGVDEETGGVVLQSPLHEEFQRLCTAHPRLVLWSHIESGKTSAVSILRVLWELGRDPTLRVAIVSDTATQSKKIVAAMKQYVERSAALREVFPEMRPGRIWSSTCFTLSNSNSTAKDPSVQAFGVHGAVVGSRIDLLVMDDVLDYENTRTPDARKELDLWVKASLLGRLTRRARVWAVGTAWHKDDQLHRLAQKSGWVFCRFPVVNETTGETTWPERWPKSRIASVAEDLGPDEAQRQLYCRTRDEGTKIFRKDWIQRCLERGDGRLVPDALRVVPSGYATYTGVDLAVSESKKAARSSLFTICLHPDGSREVLCIERGRWSGPEIIQRIALTHRRFQSIVYVESNAAQDFLRQFIVKDTGIPILPFNTGKNKHDPRFGIESLAVEMYNGKWIIPSLNGRPASIEIGEWIDEMELYDPAAHTGDILMSCWIAKEGSRYQRPKGQTGHLNTIAR